MTNKILHIAVQISLMISCHMVSSQTWCGYSANSIETSEKNRIYDNGETLFIPIIVHVLHSTEAQDISHDQIKSQLEVINEDFSRNNPDRFNTITEFQSVASNVNIQFFLDSPDDLDEKGVVRVATDHGAFNNHDIHFSTSGGSDAVSPKDYLNVWVADISGNIMGYAKNSPEFDEEEVGVVIDYKAFGTAGTAEDPFGGGRTLTHEIGHWLGLSHPWGLGGCGDGDGISDTPDQMDPAMECDFSRASCGSLDMVQNYMNLGPDNCLNLFTHGQAEIMRNHLLSEKAGLIRVGYVLGNDRRNQIRVYPNPVSEHFFIESTEESGTVELFDLSGRQMFTEIFEGNKKIELDRRQVAPGIYNVVIESGQSVYVQKLIIED